MQHHRYCSVTSVALNPNEMHCGGVYLPLQHMRWSILLYCKNVSICLSDKILQAYFTLRVDMFNMIPQCVGLIVVFSTLFLQTTSHPYHLSSTVQQQVWLFSQTIRTIHITTHDRHKLSRAQQPMCLVLCLADSQDIRKRC